MINAKKPTRSTYPVLCYYVLRIKSVTKVMSLKSQNSLHVKLAYNLTYRACTERDYVNLREVSLLHAVLLNSLICKSSQTSVTKLGDATYSITNQ